MHVVSQRHRHHGGNAEIVQLFDFNQAECLVKVESLRDTYSAEISKLSDGLENRDYTTIQLFLQRHARKVKLDQILCLVVFPAKH